MGVKQRILALVDTLLRDGNERVDVFIQLLLLAMVSVQGHVNRVTLSDDVGVLRKSNRTSHHVLHRLSGGVLGTTGGDLDDTVGTGLGEPLQSSIESLGGGHVDGRVREAFFLRAVDHLAVDFGCCDGHVVPFLYEPRDNESLFFRICPLDVSPSPQHAHRCCAAHISRRRRHHPVPLESDHQRLR